MSVPLYQQGDACLNKGRHFINNLEREVYGASVPPFFAFCLKACIIRSAHHCTTGKNYNRGRDASLPAFFVA
jgi:hypothetical protein